MKKIASIVFFVFTLTITQVLAQSIYYVDAANGNDQDDGLSLQTAWKTVGKVNSSMGNFNPGDSILFKRGSTFSDQNLTIQKGGIEGFPLTFGAYGSGNKPVFNSISIRCSASNINYVIVQDFHIKDVTGTALGFSGENASHITISRCDIESPTNNGIFLIEIDTYIIEDCMITDCGNSGIVIYGSEANPIKNGIIRRNIVNGAGDNDCITLHRSDGSPQYEIGSNHLLEDNVCSNGAEQGIDITSGSGITLRGNETFENVDSGILVGGVEDAWIDGHYSHDERGMGMIIKKATSIKITNSIIYNAHSHMLQVAPTTELRMFEAYNNTLVYGPDSSGWLITINSGVQNVKFKNNIISSVQFNSPDNYLRFVGGKTPESVNCEFNYNTWWRPDGAAEARLWYDAEKGLYNFDTWKSYYHQGKQSLFIDPQLNNTETTDFHLKVSSPCINSGVDVGVENDFDGVKRPQGSAHDIGAYEYTLSNNTFYTDIDASSTSGYEPLTVTFTEDTEGGIPPYSYNWNFDDGISSAAQNPTHTFSQSGTYTVTLTVTDSQNSQVSDSIIINVNKNNSSEASLIISSATGSPAPGSGGTTNPSPGNHSYSTGSSVQVSALPHDHYRFAKWTGDISSTQSLNDEITISMDRDKFLSAHFYTKCGDVNGDLSVSPADAQKAFDIFLGRISNPTESEKENADVNCDGTVSAPNITPADAHAIFEKFIGKKELPCDCSCKSRISSLASQSRQIEDVDLIFEDIQLIPGKEIIVPITVNKLFLIDAFGFDLVFPPDILEFIGVDKTGPDKSCYYVDANKIAEGVVRAGGYRNTPITNHTSRLLIKLVFKITGKVNKTTLFNIINTVDDLENASYKNGRLKERSQKPEHFK